MRRTGAGVRGRRFAALLATAAVAVGGASPAAFGVEPIRPKEWHLDAMHAQEMWQTSTGTGITVAVIDSGVQGDAPDLQGQLLPGMDFSGLSGGVTVDSDPEGGHGTAMASIIAGTGKGLSGQGAYGMAPGVKILPVKLNTGSATSSVGADYVSKMSQAIAYAADHGAKVINLSQGIDARYVSQKDLAGLKAAVDHANSSGSLVFAAAGNSGDKDNHVEYPAAVVGVVGVAATDQNGKSTAESEHGPQVALAAPGKDIYAACTVAPSDYCSGDGTSDATAVVSGAAALIWSAHPTWTNNQVLRVLINTAGKPQDGSSRSDYIGFGTIRPRVALTSPGDPGPADVSPLAGAAPTGAPSGSATVPGDSVSAPATGAGNAPAPGTSSSSPKKSSGSLGLIVGGAAVGLLILVLVVVLVVRSRKNTPAAAGPVPGGYPGAPQPPYGGGGYPAQQPPAPGGFPPPPQGPTPPQGGGPYAQ